MRQNLALVVIGALNYLAPSGSVAIQGVSTEITPNVSGTVVEVAVKPNEKIRKGDLLFRIDPEPFEAEVARLEAALVEAQSAVAVRFSDLASAEAEIESLEVQLEFGIQRRDDVVELAERGVNPQFALQEAVSLVGQLEASIRSAEARKRGIEARIASQIDGVDSTVAQTQRLLEVAKWELAQTSVVAPDDGVVTALALRPGDRATPMKSAVAFLPNEGMMLTGVFSQTGAHAMKPGVEVMVAMQSQPGEHFDAVIDAILPATGEGVLPATGSLPSISQLLGSSAVVVRLKLPEDQAGEFNLGSSGSATLITEDAGAMEILANILFWIQKYANYL